MYQSTDTCPVVPYRFVVLLSLKLLCDVGDGTDGGLELGGQRGVVTWTFNELFQVSAHTIRVEPEHMGDYGKCSFFVGLWRN